MKLNLNKAQEDYLFAKAWKEALVGTLDELEKDYIKDNNIKNKDGSTPEYLCMWDATVETIGKANDDFCNSSDAREVSRLHSEAKEMLTKAEDALIDFGISLAPEGIKEDLRKAAKNVRYRDKLIDITFRLDTSTIPKKQKMA